MYGRGMSKYSKEVRDKIVPVLKALGGKTDPGYIAELARELAREYLRDAQHQRLGVRHGGCIANMLPYPRDLLYKGRNVEERLAWETLRTPGEDHSGLYQREDGSWLFISEPYGMGWKSLVEAVDFCREHDLQFSISADSAHNPGQTIMVEYTHAKP